MAQENLRMRYHRRPTISYLIGSGAIAIIDSRMLKSLELKPIRASSFPIYSKGDTFIIPEPDILMERLYYKGRQGAEEYGFIAETLTGDPQCICFGDLVKMVPLYMEDSNREIIRDGCVLRSDTAFANYLFSIRKSRFTILTIIDILKANSGKVLKVVDVKAVITARRDKSDFEKIHGLERSYIPFFEIFD